jgi:hypothetical protein
VAASPRFVSPEEGDFALAAGSPCIGTGLQGSDMGAIPFEGAEPIFLRGDGNGSGRVDLSDGVYTLNHLFLGGPRPACLDVLDSNDDGALNLTDGVYTLNHLFLGGPSIAPPYPAPGPDPTPDSLPCGGA